MSDWHLEGTVPGKPFNENQEKLFSLIHILIDKDVDPNTITIVANAWNQVEGNVLSDSDVQETVYFGWGKWATQKALKKWRYSRY